MAAKAAKLRHCSLSKEGDKGSNASEILEGCSRDVMRASVEDLKKIMNLMIQRREDSRAQAEALEGRGIVAMDVVDQMEKDIAAMGMQLAAIKS